MQGQAYIELQDLLLLRAQLDAWQSSLHGVSRSDFVGQNRSRHVGRGLDFEELRHYQQGDDVRTIDWRVTARSGAPHVRVYSEERDHATVVLLDQSMSMFFGSEHNTKSVTAAKLAALLGWHALQKGDRFGLCVFDNERSHYIKPSRQMATCLKSMQAIVDYNHALYASKQSTLQISNLQRQLESLLHSSHADHNITVVSDLTGWTPTCEQLLLSLQRHHSVNVAFVYDPLEKHPERAVGLLFGDHQSQVTLDTEMSAAIQWWQQRQHTLRQLTAMGVQCVSISSVQSVDAMMLDLVSIHG